MDSAKGTTFRNHCLDDGLASIAEMETSCFQHQYPPFVSKNPSSSLRNVSWGSSSSSLSPRSATPIRSFFVGGKFFEEPQKSHFLDSCFLCKKLLGCNKDIFMYRGDTPFCSEECRQEQIEMDEAKEKSRNLSASIKALRKKEQTKSSSSSSDSTFRSSTVAAAS